MLKTKKKTNKIVGKHSSLCIVIFRDIKLRTYYFIIINNNLPTYLYLIT